MLLANGLLNRLTGAGFDEAEMKQLLDGPGDTEHPAPGGGRAAR
jgi:hypothetical protein